jgi:glutamyl-tRNA synthetase
MEQNRCVRVRFAPSPTGSLHIGGVRTALFNYLYARHHNGKFLLRIEDTDQSRSSEEMTQSILEGLQWIGLEWSEAPVYQSKRIERYREVCLSLVKMGMAYHCFCTTDELNLKRKIAQKEKGDYKYDRTCLNLSDLDVQKKIESGMPYVFRFHIPEGNTTFHDLIRGKVTVQNNEIDDFIILRSDNTPVYQVAVVVDDHDMKITHVIRGDDHLSNTPKQIMIFKSLGWPLPVFAHVPMILGPDKKRLSKRHGATSVRDYKSDGFLSCALVNFLALLGWSPNDNREILTMEELIKSFDLEGVSKNPAVFDEKKLIWLNGRYLSMMNENELFKGVTNLLVDEGIVQGRYVLENKEYILNFIKLIKGRVRKLTDFATLGAYFFIDPVEYDKDAVHKYWVDRDVTRRLKLLHERLRDIKEWAGDELERLIRKIAEEEGIGAGKIIHPTRLALTGVGVSPGLFELMELLGRERVCRRLEIAIDYMEKKAE